MACTPGNFLTFRFDTFLPFLGFWALYGIAEAVRPPGIPAWLRCSWATTEGGVSADMKCAELAKWGIGSLSWLCTHHSNTDSGFSHYLEYSLFPYTLSDRTLALFKMHLYSAWWLANPSSLTHPYY